MNFDSRQTAGQQLAQALGRYRDEDTVVLALPRGGVVIGAEIAKELHAPLGLVLVVKIGHPTAPEYAIGAVAEDRAPVYNEKEAAGLDPRWLQNAEVSARQTIRQRRGQYYGEDFIQPNIKDKIVIVADDGMATGLTMEAAVRFLTSGGARKVVVAVPVASTESIDLLEPLADEIIVLDQPENFLGAVGSHYNLFEQVDDQDVKTLLWEAQAAP